MNGFKNHSAEKWGEVSQKSNVKIVTYVKRKTNKRKRKIKNSRTSPELKPKELF